MKKPLALCAVLLALLLTLTSAFAQAESIPAAVAQAENAPAVVAQTENAPAAHARLIEAADALAARMLAACGDASYVQLFTASAQLTDAVQSALAHDFTQPTARAVLTLPPDAASRFWQTISGDAPSDAVRDVLTQKLTFSLVNFLNSQQETNWIAASAIMALSDVALLPDVPQGGYLIFTAFGDDAPMTCATVLVNDGGLASLSVTLVQPDAAQRAALLDAAVDGLSCLMGESGAMLAGAFGDDLLHAVYAAETP